MPCVRVPEPLLPAKAVRGHVHAGGRPFPARQPHGPRHRGRRRGGGGRGGGRKGLFIAAVPCMPAAREREPPASAGPPPQRERFPHRAPPLDFGIAPHSRPATFLAPAVPALPQGAGLLRRGGRHDPGRSLALGPLRRIGIAHLCAAAEAKMQPGRRKTAAGRQGGGSCGGEAGRTACPKAAAPARLPPRGIAIRKPRRARILGRAASAPRLPTQARSCFSGGRATQGSRRPRRPRSPTAGTAHGRRRTGPGTCPPYSPQCRRSTWALCRMRGPAAG